MGSARRGKAQESPASPTQPSNYPGSSTGQAFSTRLIPSQELQQLTCIPAPWKSLGWGGIHGAITEWFGLERPLNLIQCHPLPWGTFHCPSFLRTPSSGLGHSQGCGTPCTAHSAGAPIFPSFPYIFLLFKASLLLCSACTAIES